jgi:hypothetical protein
LQGDEAGSARWMPTPYFGAKCITLDFSSLSERTAMSIQTGGKQILMHGLALILAGLVWGFAPPLTPYPRLAVGAHVEFETNGLLFVAVGILVLKLPHSAGAGTIRTILVSAWLTWLMVLSEVANAWWGTNQLLPVAAKQAGAVGGAPWQELVVKLCHVPAALGLILSFVLLIVGVAKHREEGEETPA